MMHDNELLRAYWRDGSEQAFAELVNRYVDMVYSTARRRVGDSALAEDVSQTVFCLVARKSRSLSGAVTLAGWLHRATCFCAAKAVRTEMRRHKREQEAIAMNPTDNGDEHDEVWARLAPMLDDALATLGDKDRVAVLLRFFQRKRMHEVGDALGISEAAAKMRVSRSVEQLRRFFDRRGVACSSAALFGVLAERCLEAAPADLPRRLSASAMSGTAGAAGMSVIQSLRLLPGLHLKALVLGGSIAILLAAVGWQAFEASHRLKFNPAAGGPVQRKTEAASAFFSRPQQNGSVAAGDRKFLDDAIANLRAALHSTNDGMVPGGAVVEALDRFGSQRAAAFPVLKEEAGAHDKTRHPTNPEELPPRRAIFAMGLLGKSVPEAAAWLWNLYDQEPNTQSDSVAYDALATLEHIGFEPADIDKLATKVLVRIEPSRPDLLDPTNATNEAEARDVTGNAFVKSQVADWIAETIQPNPLAAAPYVPAVQKLLDHPDEDVRFWAACALLQSDGGQNPAIISEISAGLTNGSQARIAWASQYLQGLGDVARPIVPALLEAANASSGNTRDWAFLCVGNLQGDLRGQIPEVDQALTKDEANRALMDRLDSNTYSEDDLIGMLHDADSGSAAIAANLLAEKFPLATNALPALIAALPGQEDDESRTAILISIRKLDPTLALDPSDARSILENLVKAGDDSADREFAHLVDETHLFNMSWCTRPGFQTFASHLAADNPVAYDTLIPAILEKAPSWRSVLPPQPTH